MTNDQKTQNSIELQDISLPKGGGAIKSIGETFSPNIFSGTGSYSISFPITKARGFEPAISLSYNSGNGNSSFGLGFELSLSKISIRTDYGIPKYDGKDIFILDGEELVPKEKASYKNSKGFTVYEYLPRVQKNFSLIKYCINDEKSESYWEVTTTTNQTSTFGSSNSSRVYNLDNTSQIFEWLIDQSIDSKGNKIEFGYKAENKENLPNEIYIDNHSYNNKYIQSIKYGNFLDGNKNEKFAFEVLFDYGEYDILNLDKGGTDPYTPTKKWKYRTDSFSSFTSGFEIRTCRLCQNILLFHHFEKELGDPSLVKALCFTYTRQQPYNDITITTNAMLSSSTLQGYRREGQKADDKYTLQTMPSIEFGFSRFNPPKNPVYGKLKTFNNTIPGYLDNSQFLPVDLNMEGIKGLLYNDESSLLYLEPKGNGEYESPCVPSFFPINRYSKLSFTDLDGDGELELNVSSSSQKGYYKKDQNYSWDNFIPFDSYPTDISNPDNEMVNLDHNGKNDILLAKEDSLNIYPSLGKKGYGSTRVVPKLKSFPLIKKDYKEEYVGFNNIFGDGVSHRVRISNGSVECWPNLGYGRFGQKITLANPPYFKDDFDSSRMFLVDIDGSGTADIAYVYPNRVELFLNQSGNSFSDAIIIDLPEPFTNIDKITFWDILGDGTSCLVFTKIDPNPTHYYYSFAGEIDIDNKVSKSMKPYLLNSIDNNLGSQTDIEYAGSTKFYLEDKQAGTPWITKLPFPVQVVQKIITIDKITNSRFTKSYKYHDGFYNHEEKQFQGFGFVESWDSEEYDDYIKNVDQKIDEQNYVAPVYTKTWHHTGAFFDKKNISNQYKKEYFQGDKDAYDFPDSIFDSAIYNNDTKTLLQAYSALKGQVIRTEVYGLDGSDLSKNPYTVKESNLKVSLYQNRSDNRFAVFTVNPSESITYLYDRDPSDPRVEQEFSLDIDKYGNILRSAIIFLARRDNSKLKIYPEQQHIKGIIKLDSFVTPLRISDSNQDTWCSISWEEKSFELTGAVPDGDYFSFDKIKTQVDTALKNTIPYGSESQENTLQAKTLSWKKTLFWNEDIQRKKEYLQDGEIDLHALIHHYEIAEFTQEFVDDIYDKRLTSNTIYQEGGFFFDKSTNYWWNKGLVEYYFGLNGGDSNFYMPFCTQNSFAIESQTTQDKQDSSLCSKTQLSYDPYFLRAVEFTKYIDDKTTLTNSALIDYITLKPKQLIDGNDNISQVLFDPMGEVIVSSIFGMEDSVNTGGMSLYDSDGKTAEYKLNNDTGFDKILANPQDYLQGAASYFYYDLNAWKKKQPVNSINLIADRYYHNPSNESDPFSYQIAIKYSDGLGRSLEKKVKTDTQWQVSGRVVYNNKGKVFEEYLPYFSDTPTYSGSKVIPQIPPKVTYYDPLERIIGVDTPKGFFTKTEFSPWETSFYDEDDTVMDSPFYMEFLENYPANPTKEQQNEKDALDKAARFFNTPKSTVYDNLGNVFLEIELLEDSQQLISYYKTDILQRDLVSIDPRLYNSNRTKKTDYYNFKYRYSMNSAKKDKDGNVQHLPIYIDSIDGGVQKHFRNIFGDQLWSFSPRNYCQLIRYDRLQRKSKLYSKKITDDTPVTNYDDFNLVDIYTYGDSLVSSTKTKVQLQEQNLWGKLYRLNDLSGIVINHQYSIQEDILKTSRQMTTQYQSAIDWNSDPQPPLENTIYNSRSTFDARKRVISQISPDNAITINSYNQEGKLHSVKVKFSDNSLQEIINSITYNANGQRLTIKYANGVNTSYTYEDTTLYLSSLKSIKTSDNSTLQDIGYTYDPVGNITRTEDSTFKTVFNNNQVVTPQSDYTYDALYRLINAKGRQHPGINANTYKNNTANGDFMQSKFSRLSSLNSGDMLENYTQIYTYDDAGNLVQKQHSAKSSSYTRDMFVEDNSNRLRDIVYDASGNMRQLNINNDVSLSFNCCENLVKAGVIQRPDELDDCDYYLYDSEEKRTKKISQKLALGGELSLLEEKVYLGNYEIKRNYSVDKEKNQELTFERETLRVMDEDTCVTVIHHITKDKQNPNQQDTRTIRFQFGNNLGSISLELDSDAKLISYEEYFPYGGTSVIAGDNQAEVALKEYRYSGRERDDSTGLYYYGKRYYCPWLGRWLKPDPAGRVDGMNLYAFVKGNPITHIDKLGLMQEEVTFTNHEEAFAQTPGIWGRGKKKPKGGISSEKHYELGITSFTEGKKQAEGSTGNIYLFRVSDKSSIPSKKGETYTTPGNPWTHSRSIAWVKGGVEGAGKFILTTDPTDSSVFVQDRGDHQGELSIYAREVSELLASNYIPIIEKRSDLLKRTGNYGDNDYLIVLVPGMQDIPERVRSSWEKASQRDIPDFTGDFYVGVEDTVQAEDLAYQFQQYVEFLREIDSFKLYGRSYSKKL